MRTSVIAVVTMVVGTIGGVVRTQTEFAGYRERFVPNNGNNSYEERMGAVAQEVGAALQSTEGARVVVVNGEVHKFGVMEHNSKLKHEFLLKNEGTVPLRVESGGTSCPACTVSQLPKNVIEPGETLPVTVEWTSSTPDYEYRKEAYIKTSDPQRKVVLLVVQGQVLQSLRVQPEDIVFDSIPASEGAVRRFYVVVTKDRPVKILKHSFLLPATAPYFEATFTPMTPEQLALHQAARLGYAVDLTVKPGLPLGAIQQTIRLVVDWPEMGEVDVPISGTVTSDISLLGSKNFEAARNVLKIGVVKQGTEAKATVPLLIRGPYRNDVEFKVGQVEPADALQVTIGDPKPINEGAVIMRLVTVTVPATSPAVSRMGGTEIAEYGRIVLETTHPDAKQVQMLVRFAVQSSGN